jgi:hypothetical protein
VASSAGAEVAPSAGAEVASLGGLLLVILFTTF